MTSHQTENVVQEMFPYIIVRNASAAIEFYKQVFGAEELLRLKEPSGRIGHAQLKMGTAVVMLSDEHPDSGVLSPLAFGGTGSMLHVHVADVDDLTKRAVDAGAKVLAEPKSRFYGERSSKVLDPYGHIWMLGQHIEDVSTEQMQQRYTATFSKIG